MNSKKYIDEKTAQMLSAFGRAGKKARELSIQTGTPFYVWKDGKVVDLNENGLSAKKKIASRKTRA